MALWGPRNRAITFPPPQDLIPRRTARPNRLVTQETAFHNSVVWACLRLRADLVSTFPIDVFRRVPDGKGGSYQVEVPKPQALINPSSRTRSMMEWLYSSQIDLDRTGNAFGIITARDGNGIPAQVELVPATDVAVVMTGGKLQGYRIHGTVYDPMDIWHERQFTIPGLDVGLSPVAYASWSLGAYASLDQFIVEFLDNGTMPSVVMKNTMRKLNQDQAKEMKDLYRASVQNGDAMVMGADWEFTPLKADMTGLNWIAGRQTTAEDICRFFGVPHDLIDLESGGTAGSAKITYANINQRNLQFLIYNLAPTIARREEALSQFMLPGPRYIKFNTSSLLRMDDLSRAQLFTLQVQNHLRTIDEVRELDNLQPLSDEQIAEMQKMANLAGDGQPLNPMQANPNLKGLSQRREYVPIDSVGYVGPAGATQIDAQDTSHCQNCCPNERATVIPAVGAGKADAQDGCSCMSGCDCNPIGAGCIYPDGDCECGCSEGDRATPTYNPPGATPQWQGQGFVEPQRSQDVHIHLSRTAPISGSGCCG